MKNRVSNLLPPLLLFLAACALFASSIGFRLVNIDDPFFIADNPIVADGFSWSSLGRAFTLLHGDKVMYSPLLWVSYLLDNLFFGASPLSPWGYHLTNVLLHAANAVLLWFILCTAVRRPWLAFFAAAFWAIHPLRVESVAWITERKDTLSTFFAFASILAYLKAFSLTGVAGAEPPSSARHSSFVTCHCNKGILSLSFLSLLLGLLVKPMLVTLPFLFLLLDAWPLRRLPVFHRVAFRRILEKWPFFLLAFAFAFLTSHLHVGAVSQAPLFERICCLPSSYLFYFAKSVWPSALTPMSLGFPFHPVAQVVDAGILLALAALAVILFRPCPGFAVGLGAFVGLLFPVSGIVLIGMVPVADRYSYLPALGLSLALVSLLSMLSSRRGILLACCTLFVALSALAYVTAGLLPAWRNADTLCDRIESIYPDHFSVLDYRFSQAFAAGDLAAASGFADRLFAFRATNEHAVYAKLRILSQLDSSATALAFYAAYPPGDGMTDLGASIPLALAILATDIRDATAAAKHLQTARNIADDDASAHASIDQVAAWTEDTLGPVPLHSPEDRLLAATAVWNLGLRRQALPSLLRIASESPSNPAILRNVAWLLATTPGSPAQPAIVLSIARQALDLAPANPILLDTYATALAFASRFDEAVRIESDLLSTLRASSVPADSVFLADVEGRLDLFRKLLSSAGKSNNNLPSPL